MFFRCKYLQLLHNGYAQDVIRVYAFLKCNEVRHHHTQLTMQAQSVSMYTISNATMYCDHLELAIHFLFFLVFPRNVLRGIKLQRKIFIFNTLSPTNLYFYKVSFFLQSKSSKTLQSTDTTQQ